jgi:hypothetical protein
MAKGGNDELQFEIIKDFGYFGEGKWQKHLTLTKWGDNEPKYDIRPWSPDMKKPGKGITLTDSEAYDLMTFIEEALTGYDGEDEGSEEEFEEEEDYTDGLEFLNDLD